MSARNLLKINKDECRGLHLGRNNTQHCYMLWPGWPKNSPAEKDLRVLVNNKLTMRQWFKLMAKATNLPLGHARKGIESMWREMVFCLHSALKPPLENCVQPWVPQYKNKKDLLDQSSEGPQRWLEGTGASSIWGKSERAEAAQPGEERLGGVLPRWFNLMGWNEDNNARLFSVVLRDTRQWAQIENCEIPSEHKKILFCCTEAGQTCCPERLRLSMSNWASSWATNSSWPCVRKRVGLDGFMRCLPEESICHFETGWLSMTI